jgi:excisionase family DNA binding protein
MARQAKSADVGFDLLTGTEVARALRVSDETLLRWVRRGHFPPPLRFGGWLKRWRRSTVAAWLDAAQEKRAA